MYFGLALHVREKVYGTTALPTAEVHPALRRLRRCEWRVPGARAHRPRERNLRAGQLCAQRVVIGAIL